jgi:hypothetical protein
MAATFEVEQHPGESPAQKRRGAEYLPGEPKRPFRVDFEITGNE